MFKNLKQLYFGAICFVTMLLIIFYSSRIIYSFNQSIFAEYTVSTYLMNDDIFYDKKTRNANSENLKKWENYSKEKITELRIKEKNRTLIEKRHQGKKDFFDFFILLIVALFFFFMHYLPFRKNVSKE